MLTGSFELTEPVRHIADASIAAVQTSPSTGWRQESEPKRGHMKVNVLPLLTMMAIETSAALPAASTL